MFRNLILIATLLLVAAPLARADEPTTPEAARKRVQVLLTVDRDIPAAKAYVDAALERHATNPAWMPAWIEIARSFQKLEQSGHALDLLRELSKHRTGLMKEAERREIHHLMLQLTPVGTEVRSPYGLIVKVAAPQVEQQRTPLERKIHDLFDRYDLGSKEAESKLRGDLGTVIRTGGAPVHRILAEVMRSGNPPQAKLAAEMLANYAGVRAAPYLEAAVRDGDPITRSAAAMAFTKIHYRLPEEDRVTLVKVIDDLLADYPEAPFSEWLRSHLESRLLSVEELVARARAEEDRRIWLLKTARAKHVLEPQLIDAIFDLDEPEDEARALRESLINSMVSPRGSTHQIARELKQLPKSAVAALLRRLTPPDPGLIDVRRYLVLLEHVRKEDEGIDIAKMLDAYWNALSERDNLDPMESSLAASMAAGYYPPEQAWESRPVREATLRALVELPPKPTTEAVQALRGRPGFWATLLDTAATLGGRQADHLLSEAVTSSAPGSPWILLPASAQKLDWSNLLAMEPYSVYSLPVPPYLEAIARKQPAELLTFLSARFAVDDLVPGKKRRGRVYLHEGSVAALKVIPSPQLVPWIVAEIRKGSLTLPEAKLLLELLVQIGARDEAIQLVTDWTVPYADHLIGASDRIIAGERLDALLERVSRGLPSVLDEMTGRFVQQLVDRARQQRSPAAIAFLVKLYETNGDSSAASALDSIIKRKERLEAFEHLREGKKPKAAMMLDELIAKPESAARRKALVLGLAALRYEAAVPALVEVAAADADEEVRKAAMGALETMAK